MEKTSMSRHRRVACAALAAALFTSCGDAPPPAPAAAMKTEAPKPKDESRRFPKENLVDRVVVEKELMGKPFMPGGTLARYKKGGKEYELFLAKLPNATAAA